MMIIFLTTDNDNVTIETNVPIVAFLKQLQFVRKFNLDMLEEHHIEYVNTFNLSKIIRVCYTDSTDINTK